MDLSEEKAKKILRFLAWKIGFNVELYTSYDGMTYLRCMKNYTNYSIGWVSFHLFRDTDRALPIGIFQELKSSRKSYKHFLEMMLDVAKCYDIKTSGLKDAVVVMRKGTTLEELLVELDLLGITAIGK